ncbi:MAG: hypothetical protein JNL12_22800 [Planctomycetes bacterium]|nr:hypothetical protein [Planctomycetota bacterium]
MTRRPLLLLLGACLSPAPLLAQPAPPGPAPTKATAGQPGQPQEPNPKAPAERVYRGPYDTTTSRDLFSACDRDADDRLDVLEAGEALDGVRDAKDHDGFARYDSDRDGYVSWPEFDAMFRQSLRQKGAVRLRPSRPLRSDSRGNSELQQFLRLHDGNRDSALDPAEIERLVRLGILPPALTSKLRSLDHDGSGRLEETELAPWFEQLPRASRPTTDRPGAGSLLPAPWNRCDADRDQAISKDELGLALRRLDPSLERWVPQLLQKLDQNRDGKLQSGELPAEAAAAAPLPSESPLR